MSVVTIRRSEDYKCGPGAAFCMLFMSFANCYGEHICDFLVMKETLGKSLCSATVCTLGRLPLLVGPAFLCRGTSKLLFLPPLCVTFQNTSARPGLTAEGRRRGFTVMCLPGEGPHFF